MTLQKNLFITVEGIEGVGKSTAVKFIYNNLTTQHHDVVLTREPGGTPIAEDIRRILLTPNPDESLCKDTELLLMFACRAQHIAEVIRPALKAGKWVLSDRFVDASYAYQGFGRKLDLSRIAMLDQWIVGDIKPNLTLLLDASPEIGLTRAKHRGAHDRIEQEKVDFFERVREGYLKRAQEDPTRFKIIDAAKPLAEVQEAISALLQAEIAKR